MDFFPCRLQCSMADFSPRAFYSDYSKAFSKSEDVSEGENNASPHDGDSDFTEASNKDADSDNTGLTATGWQAYTDDFPEFPVFTHCPNIAET